MTRYLLFALAACVAAGCYASYPFTLDDDTGSLPDAPDTGSDSEDTAADEILTEVPPDIPHDGTPTCGEPESYNMTVTFSFDEHTIYENVALSLSCGVPSVSGGSSIVQMLMWCEDGAEHMLEIQVHPDMTSAHAPITEEVKIDYVSMDLGEGWAFRWFRMRDLAGNLMMALVQSNRLAPPGVDSADWYHPAWVDFTEGLCPVENPGCYSTERVGVDIICAGVRGRVFEDCRENIGSGACLAQVGEAFRTHRISCAGMEIPSMYFSMILIL